MEMIKEVSSFDELYENSWSGARDTLRDIINADKEDEFMDYLEEVFACETPTETEVNDFIWFERDAIYEAMGLNENGELIEEEEFDEFEEFDEENEVYLEAMTKDNFDDFCNTFFGCDNCPFAPSTCHCGEEEWKEWKTKH